MDNDSLPKWAELRQLRYEWWATKKTTGVPDNLWAAVLPFLEFVRKHSPRGNGWTIPWSHRWYILWNGKLPEDF